jgi:hypothetical protein
MKRKGKAGESRRRKATGLPPMKIGHDRQAAETKTNQTIVLQAWEIQACTVYSNNWRSS